MEKPAVAQGSKPWSLKMMAPLEPGIVCIDMERMLKFYTGVLGLTLVADAETAPEMSAKFRATPHGYRIVRLQTPYGERVKLVQPKVPPIQNPMPEWVFQRQGFAYMTFIIDDMPAMVARLKANNVRLVSEEPVEVRKGVFALFSIDPEGNYVEFVHFPDVAAYRPDLFKK
ncbi:MAG: VOC family protein [Candidatus Korobacteraceae bacterium]|jgi:catechol 2,3-dioxygenase-like lactoylglutathione lyase family enzyme